MHEIGTMHTISTLSSDTPLLQKKKVSYGFLPKEKKKKKFGVSDKKDQ